MMTLFLARPVRWLACVLGLAIWFALPATAQLQFHLAFGGGAGEGVGASVAAVGDVDGDGVSDVLVTAPAVGASPAIAGRYYLLSATNGSIIRQKVSANLDDEFGALGVAVGDVTGDGVPDYVVTAPANDNPLQNCGRVRVYSGANGSTALVLVGVGSDYRFGDQVAALGDLNGDGITDLAVSIPGRRDHGYVFTYSGADGTELEDNIQNIDAGLANVGDLNGDGIDDLACGEILPGPWSTNPVVGRVRLRSGLNGWGIANVDGSSVGDEFGAAITGLGDVDGDGIDDFAVGAPAADGGPGLSGSGLVRVVSGSDRSTLYTLSGRRAGDRFGSSLARMGDLDGDGVSELVVGAPHGNPDATGVGTGEVAIYSGATGFRLDIIADGVVGSRFGAAVSSAGDVNGDGLDDLLVGAPSDSMVAPGSAQGGGSVRIYLGQSFALVPGAGEANGPNARFEVNARDTGQVPGPLPATLWRGEHFSFDLEGAPFAFFEIYGSYTLNPGAWQFPGFGTFDIGTGPAFADVYVVIAGFSSTLPLYQLDASGRATLDYYLPTNWPVGSLGHVQALIQNAQPWTGGIWGSLSAAQSLLVR